MGGPKTDQRLAQQSSRINPRLKAIGDEIKDLYKELGFTQRELFEALPADIPYNSLETFRKLLSGRSSGAAYKAHHAIIDILTARTLEMFPSAKIDGYEATKIRIQARILGDAPIAAESSEATAAGSFWGMELPDSETEFADEFLDARPPKLADIAAGFDIPRTAYVENGGLRDRTLTVLRSKDSAALFLLGGPSGAGKTTMSRRLAFDCLEAGFGVFCLHSDWASPVALSQQIREIVTHSQEASLFIVDGTDQLAKAGIPIQDVFDSLTDLPVPVVVLGIENLRQLTEKELRSLTRDSREARHWNVGAFSEAELGELVDHVIRLEVTGRVRHVKCNLSRSARLELLNEVNDKIAVVALLMLRYGQSVSAILIDEFDALTGTLSQEIYRYIILFSGLGLDIPSTVVARLLRRSSAHEANFWANLEVVTARRNDSIGLRHQLFFKYLAAHALPSNLDRVSILIKVLLTLSEDSPDEDDFAHELFGKTKAFAALLQRDESALRELIGQGLEVGSSELAQSWRSDWLTCIGRLSAFILLDREKAEICFSAAIVEDPFNKFAHRQKTWNLLHLGRSDAAKESAEDAVRHFPEDIQTLLQSAMVLQYTDEAGFDLAGQLFETARRLAPDNDEIVKLLDRYEDADAYRKYIDRNWGELEDDVLKRLKAPWYIWAVRKGVGSNRVKQAIRNKVAGLIQDPMGDADQIKEVARSFGEGGDKFTKGLIAASLGRAEYVNWYQSGGEIDEARVLQMFEGAIKDAPEEPFVRTWFGTFLKEVMNDVPWAEREYRAAIRLAASYVNNNRERPFLDHPMLLNNLAILLMERSRTANDPDGLLREASDLLNRAIIKVEGSDSRFMWPFDTRDELNRLRAEFEARIINEGRAGQP